MMDKVARTGSCQYLSEVPEDVKLLFKVANEISPEYHVRMQAAFQEHTDLAVSKTINMANSATIEDVENSYWLAYRNHCKGITIYRDGSKSMQVLEVQRPQSQESIEESFFAQSKAPLTNEMSLDELNLLRTRPRPDLMTGITQRVRTGHGNTYITINFDQNSDPFEVFTTLGKAGGCDAANLEAITRMVSLALRSGISPEDVIDQLQGITCHPVWDQGQLIRSAPDAVATVLRRHINYRKEGVDLDSVYGAQLGLPIQKSSNGEGQTKVPDSVPATGFACPECGGTVAFQEGCVICQICAWNQCGG